MFYDYGNDSDGGESWDDTPVTFLRPDGDWEGKDVQWCLDNDFFEVEEGVWSGDWYYESNPQEKRLHPLRLKRTREIRQQAQQRRSRVRNQRARSASLQLEQDAAFNSVLMEDLARMQMGRWSEDYFWGQSNSHFQSPLYQYGSGYANAGFHEPSRNQPWYKTDTDRMERKEKRSKHEVKEERKLQILEELIRWAQGDQGIVDRARTAFNEVDGRLNYKCPCKGCPSHFPSQEIAELHVQNAPGKGHKGYRRELDIVEPNYRESQELVVFHLKNDPRHRRFRLENGMAEQWDQDLPERFPCPVCPKWFLSQENLKEHLDTTSGRAHNEYRGSKLRDEWSYTPYYPFSSSSFPQFFRPTKYGAKQD